MGRFDLIEVTAWAGLTVIVLLYLDHNVFRYILCYSYR